MRKKRCEFPCITSLNRVGVQGGEEKHHSSWAELILSFSYSVVAGMAEQLVGLIFLIAGAGKLLARVPAAQSIEAYRLLPEPVARLVGLVLPVVELVIASSLLTGFLADWTALGALGLLLVFSVAQASVLLRGQEVPCGCFGSLSSRPVRWGNVLSNLALAACCVLASNLFVSVSRFRWTAHYLSSENSTPVPADEIAGLQFLTAALFLQFLIFRQIGENRNHQLGHAQYLRALAEATAVQNMSQGASHQTRRAVS
jgi:hypothetical protein